MKMVDGGGPPPPPPVTLTANGRHGVPAKTRKEALVAAPGPGGGTKADGSAVGGWAPRPNGSWTVEFGQVCLVKAGEGGGSKRNPE